MTSPQIPDPAREAFYGAAILGLRALDARERAPRRFGADAETRWTAFRGRLTDADRIDILLRDASFAWGAAFSAADVFGLFGLAPDEPFGPDWRTLTPTSARQLLGATSDPPTPEAIARLLQIEPVPVELPPLTPSTRLAVAGGAALIAVANAFVRTPGLSWSDQVLVIATSPAHRQLAGLIAVLLGARGKTRLVRPGPDPRAVLKEAGLVQVDDSVVSPDAEPDCSAFIARALKGA